MPLFGQGYRKFRFEVFDRWGGLAFRSRDPAEAWDGTHKKSHCPEGVYVWKFFGELKDGNAVEKHDTVKLIRWKPTLIFCAGESYKGALDAILPRLNAAGAYVKVVVKGGAVGKERLGLRAKKNCPLR